jgi:hypothetical protein
LARGVDVRPAQQDRDDRGCLAPPARMPTATLCVRGTLRRSARAVMRGRAVHSMRSSRWLGRAPPAPLRKALQPAVAGLSDADREQTKTLDASRSKAGVTWRQTSCESQRTVVWRGVAAEMDGRPCRSMRRKPSSSGRSGRSWSWGALRPGGAASHGLEGASLAQARPLAAGHRPCPVTPTAASRASLQQTVGTRTRGCQASHTHETVAHPKRRHGPQLRPSPQKDACVAPSATVLPLSGGSTGWTVRAYAEGTSRRARNAWVRRGLGHLAASFIKRGTSQGTPARSAGVPSPTARRLPER